MIAYYDSSALVPLVIHEASSSTCLQVWAAASEVVTSRLAYVEATAALARAARSGRIPGAQLDDALTRVDDLFLRLEVIEFDPELAVAAARAARSAALRGADAVHCASAVLINKHDLVALSGDRQLLAAWHSMGVSTMDTAA